MCYCHCNGSGSSSGCGSGSGSDNSCHNGADCLPSWSLPLDLCHLLLINYFKK